MNGMSLASGSIIGLGACGGRNLCPQRVGGGWGFFFKVTEGNLVRSFWVEGSVDRMWKPSVRIRLRW